MDTRRGLADSNPSKRPEADVIKAARKVLDLSRPGWPNEHWYGVQTREMDALEAALAALTEDDETRTPVNGTTTKGTS